MKIIFVVMLVASLAVIPNVSGIGVSPPQLRLTEAPMGANVSVASLSAVNTGNEDVYMILKVGCLSDTREHKLRVICDGCNREVGIQRGDLVNGACPFCNSTNLVHYDFPPGDIMDGISFACADYPIEKIDDRIYKTIGKILPGEAANMDIYVSIPDIKEYYNKHWEVRITVTAISNMSRLSDFIVYGIDSKFLIDTQVWIEEIATEKDYTFIFLAIGLIGVFVALAISVLFFKSRKKDVLLTFPKDGSKERRVQVGRRKLL